MKDSGGKFSMLRRVLIASVKWTAGVLCVFLLTIVAINCFDEDLSPEAKNLLVAPPNPYEPEENLYLTMLGFEAPSGESMLATGQARLSVYEELVAAALRDPQLAHRGFSEWIDGPDEKLVFEGKVDFCRPMYQSCIAGLKGHKAELAQLLIANAELYSRYLGLHQLKGYHETATPSIFAMAAYVPTRVRQLFLANVASRVMSGNRLNQKAAIADLRDDIRTWRRLLTGSGSLISKMISVACLQMNYALLADIIENSKIDSEYFSVEIEPLLELIGSEDWKIGEVFIVEYRTTANLWNQMRGSGQWQIMGDSDEEGRKWWEPIVTRATSFFIQFNATQNLDARLKTQLQEIANSEPATVFSELDEYSSWFRGNLDFGLRWAYNPLGKAMLAISSSVYEEYVFRTYDVAAFQRLVRLGYEIRTQKVRDDAIPAFMRQHPQWSTHPIDGKTFIWNDQTREIAVQVLAKQPEHRHFSISVWNAAS